MNTQNTTESTAIPEIAVPQDPTKIQLDAFMKELTSIAQIKWIIGENESLNIRNGILSFVFKTKTIYIHISEKHAITDIRYSKYSMFDYFQENSIALTPSNIIDTFKLYLETQESITGNKNSFPKTVKTRHIVTHEVYRILWWASIIGVAWLSFSVKDPYHMIMAGAPLLPIPYMANRKKQKLKILKYLREQYPKDDHKYAWFNKEHSDSWFW